MRLTIDLPEQFSYTTDIPVLAIHLNYGNHLDSSMLLTLVSEARNRYLAALGYTEADMEGVAGVVADTRVLYTGDAFQGDIMAVELTCQDFHRKGFDLVWRMTNKATGHEVSRGKMAIICIDLAARKTAEIPEKLVKRLSV